jgi:hypothetical protein
MGQVPALLAANFVHDEVSRLSALAWKATIGKQLLNGRKLAK